MKKMVLKENHSTDNEQTAPHQMNIQLEVRSICQHSFSLFISPDHSIYLSKYSTYYRIKVAKIQGTEPYRTYVRSILQYRVPYFRLK